MNLTWHIFKKDFVRLRLALGLWVVMLAVEILLNLRLLSSAAVYDRWYSTAEACTNLFTFTVRVAAYILVASLVLDDPLLGTKRMFWVTRPISGGRLLRAKLIGIVLLLFVLPVLIRLPWWLYCGFGWKDLGAMAGIEFVQLIVIAVPAVTLASLSGESSKFLLYSLLLVVATVATFAVWRFSTVDPDLLGSRVMVVFFLALISATTVTVWLYLTRRFRVATVCLASVAALVVLCLYCWPWNLEQWSPEDKEQLVGTENGSVEIVRAEVYPLRKGSSITSDYVILRLHFKNVPDKMIPVSGTAKVEFSWPDGTVIRPKRVSFFPQPNGVYAIRQLLEVPVPAADAETEAKNRELALRPLAPAEAKSGRIPARVDPPEENGFFALTKIQVTPEQARRLESGYATCTVGIRVELARPEVLLEMPLKDGVEQVGSGFRLHLLALEEESQNRRLEADGRLNHGYRITVVNAHAPTSNLELLVVNRRYGTIGRIDSYRSSITMPLLSETRRQIGYLPTPQLWRTDKWIVAPNYLADSALVVVTNRNVGGFNREIRLDRLEINRAKAQ